MPINCEYLPVLPANFAAHDDDDDNEYDDNCDDDVEHDDNCNDDDDDDKGLSIYYEITDRGEGSAQKITVLPRGGLAI